MFSLTLQKIESVLLPGSAYWDLACTIAEVKSMKSKWYHYFKGRQPHTKVIKREEYYLMAFWLGERSKT